MSKYICKKCGYVTKYKSHYNDHINRELPCNPNKIHGNIKEFILTNKNDKKTKETIQYDTPDSNISEKKHTCTICNMSFSRKDSLRRHLHESETHKNNIKHNNTKTKIIGDNNTSTNIHKQIINTDNVINNIDNSTTNNINVILPPQIHNYCYNNINDLSLFEQYLLFSYNISIDSTPYTSLLDYLNFNPDKPQYHNINYKNINKNIFDIYNGREWILGTATIIEKLVFSQRILLCSIFNKFRIFLGRRSHLFGIIHLYNGLHCGNEYKKMHNDIKMHLYNKRNMNQLDYTDENIPKNRDHLIWKSLSKTFEWNEVISFITKFDELGISFDDNLDRIKINLEKCIDKSKKMRIFFEKLIKRINFFIYEHLNEKDVMISSESDELEVYDKSCKDYGCKLNPTATYQKREEERIDRLENPLNYAHTNKSIKKQNVENNDHNKFTKKIRYHSTSRIGKKYETSSSDDQSF